MTALARTLDWLERHFGLLQIILVPLLILALGAAVEWRGLMS